MNNQKLLWEKLAKENSRYYINSNKGRGITEEQFRDSGEIDTKRFILDDPLIYCFGVLVEIGCGTGRMTEFIANYFKTIYALDISAGMIIEAYDRLRKIKNIRLIETDGQSIPIESNKADVIFSYLVFQHIKTKEMVEKNFKEAYRVLKKDGLFKVRVRTDKVDVNKWWGGVGYSDDEVDELIKNTGFRLLKKEPVENYGLWLWLTK